MESFGFRSPYCTCSHHHYYGRPEPWTRRQVIVAWAVAALFVVSSAAAITWVRDFNERDWCGGGGERPVSRQCLADQSAIRCGPLGIFHCADSGD